MFGVRSFIGAQLNSLRHSAGPLAFGLQAQSRGCVNLVCVKGWFDDDEAIAVARLNKI